MSSTVFVTHHRNYMEQQSFNAITGKHEQVQYHCRKEGEADCKCTCNAHTPCAAKKGGCSRTLSCTRTRTRKFPISKIVATCAPTTQAAGRGNSRAQTCVCSRAGRRSSCPS